jgi:hypothetical protein
MVPEQVDMLAEFAICMWGSGVLGVLIIIAVILNQILKQLKKLIKVCREGDLI